MHFVVADRDCPNNAQLRRALQKYVTKRHIRLWIFFYSLNLQWWTFPHSLLSFRGLFGNNLEALSPGIFDPLTSLTQLYGKCEIKTCSLMVFSFFPLGLSSPLAKIAQSMPFVFAAILSCTCSSFLHFQLASLGCCFCFTAHFFLSSSSSFSFCKDLISKFCHLFQE